MNRGKREKGITLHAPLVLKVALKEIAKREDRSVSSWLLRLAERDASVQVVLQQIEGRTGKQ